jgi:hypothetical protein
LKDIAALINELAEEADVIISSPATRERLEREGIIQFQEPPKRTIKEALDLLFDKRKQAALDVVKQLPEPPVGISAAIGSLYNEIRECMIFGLNGAAITLSGILVEFVLKYAAFKCEMGGFANYDAKKWDEFEKLDFSKSIGRASKVGLLSKENKKQLNNFKDRCRNPYNHYNIKKITDSVVAERVRIVNLKTNEVEERDIAAKDDPVIQAQAKPFVDARSVLDVFQFADSAVKALLEKTADKIRENAANEGQA